MEERNGERNDERSLEESDLLSRSTKKMKRTGGDPPEPDNSEEMDTGSPIQRAPEQNMRTVLTGGNGPSYRDTLQRNNPNLYFDMRDNPIWAEQEIEDNSDDDAPEDDDDPLCPTIRLSAAEKRALRAPWRNALIVRMFDKGIGYLQLKRRLKAKWALRGDFSLIDIGCDYYVTRFTNTEDYDHVLLNGPWMIGDNYLVIREWVPNFVPEEDSVTKLTAWVRIPKLSVEYFNKNFLLQKIGTKIGRVLRVDSTTENVERGQYTRMSVEVDLTKPLLSKFRLNGRVWGIQHEGLKMICFKCGRQGHKEESCPMDHQADQTNSASEPHVAAPAIQSTAPHERDYGSWMLVKKPQRRRNNRQQSLGASHRVGQGLGLQSNPTEQGVNRTQQTDANRTELNLDVPQNQGSRFRALEEVEPNMDTGNLGGEIALGEVSVTVLEGNTHTESVALEGRNRGIPGQGGSESPRNRERQIRGSILSDNRTHFTQLQGTDHSTPRPIEALSAQHTGG